MKLYCMCHQNNNKPESQAFMAPNLWGPYDKETEYRTVVLKVPMERIKNGLKQILLHDYKKVNDWTEKTYISPDDVLKEHYPNVDFFECKNCGARIVVE